jgi:hypothetical protein
MPAGTSLGRLAETVERSQDQTGIGEDASYGQSSRRTDDATVKKTIDRTLQTLPLQFLGTSSLIFDFSVAVVGLDSRSNRTDMDKRVIYLRPLTHQSRP